MQNNGAEMMSRCTCFWDTNNDKNIQLLVNAINQKLGNYNSTISIAKPSNLNQGNSEKLNALISDMKSGDVSALITYNVNPSYSLEKSNEFNEALQNVNLKILQNYWILNIH